MEVFHDLKSWRAKRQTIEGQTIGFVPTMGALHEGHLSLVEKSRAKNRLTVVSIFVNPTQFNDPQDLKNYPKQIEQDLALLEKAGVDFVILPTEAELYPDRYRYRVSESEESKVLCGAHRPGHFDGVLTIVLKLLNLVQACRAYFGEKDFQQLRLIQGMVDSFFINTQIVACETRRESDGLAMSSRNLLLSQEVRKLAPTLNRVLRNIPSLEDAKAELLHQGFKVDYIEER